jgi:glycosyltransferase involved in cell wall biosynthesis
MKVALAHDYLTLRGGAERVVLAMAEAFPDAPIYTSLYEPDGTFEEFRELDVRTSPLNRLAVLRHHHRLAMPLLAPALSRMDIDADVVLCSSSGWAHGIGTRGRTVVYCHTPAQWLYDPQLFLGETAGPSHRVALAVARRPLLRWDRKAAARATTYLVNSTTVAERVRRAYHRESELLHPPPALTPDGPAEPVAGVEPGSFLVVSRLFEYKNLAAVVAAVELVPGARLVIVGRGPDEDRLRRLAGPATRFLLDVDDRQLRWLYASCVALVAAADEDFGLTPVEAYAFGRPALCWRRGGYLDSMNEGVSGLFFDTPTAADIAEAMRAAVQRDWDTQEITRWSERFGREHFVRRLREVVGGTGAGTDARS